jgi:polyribonucleotide nucleotidyltransferase
MKVVDQQTGEDITEKVKAQRDADRAERGDEPREPREGGRHRGERRREAGE